MDHSDNHVAVSSFSSSTSSNHHQHHHHHSLRTTSSKPSHFECFSTIVLGCGGEYSTGSTNTNGGSGGGSGGGGSGRTSAITNKSPKTPSLQLVPTMVPSTSTNTTITATTHSPHLLQQQPYQQHLCHLSSIELQIKNSTQRLKTITSGDYHSFYLYENGHAQAIGDNSKYQLNIRPFTLSHVNHLRSVNRFDIYINTSNIHKDDHNNIITSRITQPPNSNMMMIAKIASKYDHTLFLTQDGQVYSCGCNNQYGQLGTGTFLPSHVPFPIQMNFRTCLQKQQTPPSLTSSLNETIQHNQQHPKMIMVTLIATGKEHSLFVAEHNHQSILFGCGSNRYGQLGMNHLSTSVNVTIPLEIMSFDWNSNNGNAIDIHHEKDLSLNDPSSSFFSSSNLKKIDCGHHHSAVLCQNGDLYMFGRNDKCQCLISNRQNISHKNSRSNHHHHHLVDSITKPRIVLSHIEDVSCGEDFTVAYSHSYLYISRNEYPCNRNNGGNDDWGGMNGSSSCSPTSLVERTEISKLESSMIRIPLSTLFKMILKGNTRSKKVTVCGLGTLSHHRTVLLLRENLTLEQPYSEIFTSVSNRLVPPLEEIYLSVLNEQGQCILSWKYGNCNNTIERWIDSRDELSMNVEYTHSLEERRNCSFKPKHDYPCQCGACFTTKVMMSCGKENVTIVIERYCHLLYQALCNDQWCDIKVVVLE
nr:unnamed protein product [Naegleria fowleri]